MSNPEHIDVMDWRLLFCYSLARTKFDDQAWRFTLRVLLSASMILNFGDDLALSLASKLGVFSGLIDWPEA